METQGSRGLGNMHNSVWQAVAAQDPRVAAALSATSRQGRRAAGPSAAAAKTAALRLSQRWRGKTMTGLVRRAVQDLYAIEAARNRNVVFKKLGFTKQGQQIVTKFMFPGDKKPQALQGAKFAILGTYANPANQAHVHLRLHLFGYGPTDAVVMHLKTNAMPRFLLRTDELRRFSRQQVKELLRLRQAAHDEWTKLFAV